MPFEPSPFIHVCYLTALICIIPLSTLRLSLILYAYIFEDFKSADVIYKDCTEMHGQQNIKVIYVVYQRKNSVWEVTHSL
jgi:hypothetical protein